MNAHIDYVLPANVDAEGVVVRLPLQLTTVISLFYWAWMGDPERKLKEDIVEFECGIDFTDIGGVSRHQQFQLAPKLLSLAGGPHQHEGVLSISTRISAVPH